MTAERHPTRIVSGFTRPQPAACEERETIRATRRAAAVAPPPEVLARRPLGRRDHLVFDQADNRGEYCASHTTANCLTDERADIEPTACVGQ